MSKLILKVKEVKGDFKSFVVKNGNEVYAKIIAPNKWHSGWNVEFEHCAQIDFESLDEAVGYVQRHAQAKLEILGVEGVVEVEVAV